MVEYTEPDQQKSGSAHPKITSESSGQLSAEQLQKYDAFVEWCAASGIEYPNQEFPAIFDGGLVGVRALKDIQHREAFCKVPFKCLLSVYSANQDPELGPVIRANPELFSEDEEDDAESLVLVLMILREMQKGSGSFWKPYFDVLPDVTIFCNWEKEEIEAAQDPLLQKQADRYRKEYLEQWESMKECMEKYPLLFKSETINFELFTRVYGWVQTRCFDTHLAKTVMVPMSDMYNHSHFEADLRCIVKRLQLTAGPKSGYFTRSKFMGDYSFIFWSELQELAAAAKSEAGAVTEANIRGRLVRENYEKNQQYQSLAECKKMIEQGVCVWDVPRLQEPWERQGTKEESDSEDSEDEEEQTAIITKMMGELMVLDLDVKVLAKGFDYMMKRELKEIDQVRVRVKE